MEKFEIELDSDVAYQLTQFCKRSTFDMFFNLTEAHLSNEEREKRAYLMISGIEAVSAALANKRYAPR